MSSDAKLKLGKIIGRIKNTMNAAIAKAEMDKLGEYAIVLIVKRTLLGYGVSGSTKAKLKSLSPKYVKMRQRYSNLLASSTSPKKSNLTFSGQMLGSMSLLSSNTAQVVIGPDGNRSDSSKTNLQIAGYNSEKGRTFNRLSELEYKQLLRYYRNRFGDLLGKQGLLR